MLHKPIYISDSESDLDDIPDDIENKINYKFQEKFSTNIKSYRKFINRSDWITPSNDETTNIIDRNAFYDNKIAAKSYNIPEDKIYKLCKHLEICRRTKDHMMVAERQQEYSGLMIDIDIHQKTAKSTIDNTVYTIIIGKVVNIMQKYINFENLDVIYSAVTKKPQTKYNKEKKYYKDGFHILFPGIKLTRPVKKFLLKKFIEENIISEFAKIVDFADGYDESSLIDTNSAHVPVFFVGSSTKPGDPPYELQFLGKNAVDEQSYTYSANTIFGYNSNNSSVAEQSTDVIMCHELSLNWENNHKTAPIIVKRNYDIKEQFMSEIVTYDKNEEQNDAEVGELSVLNIHDPDANYIEELLNSLSSFRYTEFNDWFKVLCVLAHTSKSYKYLAEKFSMKCIEKFNVVDFEHHWQSACSDKASKLNIGSLHFWAKNDNPAKYDIIRQTSVYNMVYGKIFDRQIEGSLQHYDVGQILFKSLRHKYAYDISNGGAWYEFILEEDPQSQGEVFKWRSYTRSPNSIKIYTSEILPRLFDKMFDKMDTLIETADGDDRAKFNMSIKHNLKITCRKLRDNGFKTGVIREAEQLFERIKFADSLDKDPQIMGVGNGIIKLDKTVEFITGYHNYAVSKHTSVKYKEFNPYEPITKKVLYVIRNLFPDNEPDTFLFMMCYFAAALDGQKKESLLTLIIGHGSNGKSFLLELFKETIGPYGVKMPLAFLTSRQKNAEGATPATMMLVDARVAHYSESSRNEALHLAKFKEVSGQETLSGRKNYGDMMNFKPACHHVVTSNFDFEINGGDHGTWRRLKRIAMRIKFCKQNVDDYDPENPYERIADLNIGKKWPEDPEVQSAFLSILCYYYEILQNEYDGVVENIPHPNIMRDTENYRNRQDKINNFINIRFVKTVDKSHRVPMSTIIEKYTKWYDSLYPDDKEYKKSIGYQFEDSKLSKVIEKEKMGVFVKGYRILDSGEEPDEGETYFMDSFTDKKSKYGSVTPETADEFYARMCADYEAKKTIKQNIIKKEADELRKKRVIHKKELIIPRTFSKPAISKPNNDYDKAGFKKVKPLAKEFMCESESEESDE